MGIGTSHPTSVDQTLFRVASGKGSGSARLRLAMEKDEEKTARLENMVATTQLRLALETEEERKQKMDWI